MKVRGVPVYAACLGFATAFGGSGYIIAQDLDNGISTATGWSLIYSIIYAYPALKMKKPIPIAMGMTMMAGGLIYGRELWREVLDW